MITSYYSRLKFGSLSFQEVKSLYVEWVLGVKRFIGIQERRLQRGIDPTWSMREIHDGTTLDGRYDSQIASRVEDGAFLLRLVHRDEFDTGVFWHNVIGIYEDQDGTSVAHAVGRSVPPGHELKPFAAAPSSLRSLITWNGSATIQPMVSNTFAPLNADDVDLFIDYELASPTRTVPILYISTPIESDVAIVREINIASYLLGMAKVVVCANKVSTDAFNDGLEKRGFSSKFQAWDGAVRLYQPGLNKTDDPYRHGLWLRAVLESFGDKRESVLAGEVAERIVRANKAFPKGFWSLIERYDLAILRTQASNIAAERKTTKRLRELIEGLSSANDRLAADLASAEDARQLAEMERDEQKSQCDFVEHLYTSTDAALSSSRCECHDMKAKLDAVTSHFEKSKECAISGAADSVSGEIRGIIGDLLANECTPLTLLMAISIAHKDSVVVLQSAYKAAKEHGKFRHIARLRELLLTLVTTYIAAVNNNGDVVARKLLGKSYAAQDANDNQAEKRDRTFTYNGSEVLMLKHLKIGNNDSNDDTIRVHFEVLGGKVVIGHCGPHLYVHGESKGK